jgi:aspartyl/asparaginyl beta-hydroxylase (cupin superfamily)
MTVTMMLGALAAARLAAARWATRHVRHMTAKQKKALLKKSINNVFTWFEERGHLDPAPAFIYDYHSLYPELKLLEEGYDDVRAECEQLLQIKDKLTDTSKLGGAYTQRGIHVIQWKTFLFKSGKFVEPNCELAPKTAAILRKIPGCYTAFFSILDPDQYITPHWGYYKGFLRYHLGVVIPNDNANGECYLRVNSDPKVNEVRDPEAVDKGEVYYWRNGEGIVFNDNYLHDARNASNEIRVVLWLDMRRRMPLYLQAFNMLCLAIAHRERSVKQIRKNTLIDA